MSRLFTEEGQSIPVTAISIAGNFISDIKTSERDGYEALVVSKIKKSNNRNKSQVEYFKKRDIQPGILAEFKTKDIDDHQIGSHLTADIFEIGVAEAHIFNCFTSHRWDGYFSVVWEFVRDGSLIK